MSKRLAGLVFGLVAGCQVVAGLSDREAGKSAGGSGGSAGSIDAGGGTDGSTTAGAQATSGGVGAGGSVAVPGGEGGAGTMPMGDGGMGGEGAAMTEAGAGGEGGSDVVVPKCVANQPSCDQNTAVVCNANGTGFLPDVDVCTSEQTCVLGVCKTHECVPSLNFCSGKSLRLCAIDGLSSAEVSACGADQYCDAPSKSCKNGICSPNQPACDGDRATTCNAAGSGYAAGGTTCSATQACDAGTCKAHVCEPDAIFCTGQDVKVCASNGLSSTVQSTCSANKTCLQVGTTASCAGVCGPGQTHCAGNSSQACDGMGQWGSTVDCQTGKYCNAGACVSCPGTTLNCDANSDNACEVDLSATVSCGTGCGNVVACSTAHGTPSCSNSSCGISCAAPYGNCGGTNDGCETNLSSDPNNCQTCGKVCSSNNMATRTCGNSTCNGACSTGYDDCDANKQTNGCETHIDVDPNACGNCTNVCKYRTCQGGACVSTVWGNKNVTTAPEDTKLAKDLLWAMPVVISPAGGTTSLQALGVVVVVNGSNPAVNVKLGLYSNSSGGAPQTLQAQSAAFTTVNGVNEQLLATPVTISQGEYWLALVASGDIRIAADSAATVSWSKATLTYTGGNLPTTYPLPSPLTVERGHLFAVTAP
jgi:hypothetical protein